MHLQGNAQGPFFERPNDEALSLEEIENRFDGNDIVLPFSNQSAQGHFTARVEGNDVVGPMFPGLEIKCSLTRVDPDDPVLEEPGAAVLSHFLYMQTNILRAVDPGEQPWSHAGIVVIRGRADERDPVDALNIRGKVQENGEVGVPTPD